MDTKLRKSIVNFAKSCAHPYYSKREWLDNSKSDVYEKLTFYGEKQTLYLIKKYNISSTISEFGENFPDFSSIKIEYIVELLSSDTVLFRESLPLEEFRALLLDCKIDSSPSSKLAKFIKKWS